MITARVLEGDPAPGTGGGTFASFQQALGTPIASSGAVAFAAGIAGGRVAFAATVDGDPSFDGVFVDQGGSDLALALAGDPAPGSGGGVLENGALVSDYRGASRAPPQGSSSP